ncbi:hypothetical protein M758_5G116700 [Ceratodon purpureus]|nr:hypothetical protein M758_5G116700 [Ceratodon purpureus]
MGTREDRNEKDDVAMALHAVVIPLPAQGHIAPAILLAKKLVGLGFRITFVNTTPNHEQMMKSRSKAMEPEKGIEFVSISDGLPDDHPRERKWTEFSNAILAMGPAFEEFFVNLLRMSPISCVIRDIRFTAVQASATKLGIPVVGIAACPAIALQCALKVPTLLSMGILPLPPPPPNSTPSLHPVAMTLGLPRSEEEAAARQAPLTGVVTGASPTMRVEHMPTHFLTHELVSHWNHNPLLLDCDCLLFNPFHDLEGAVLDAMAEELKLHVLGVGPLSLNSSTTEDGVEEVAIAGAGSFLREEDPVALSWLDGRSPKSVLFVSFGSEATPSMEQAEEFAHGLEMSGHAFLWVIRSDTIDGMCEASKDFGVMFSEFLKQTQNRGLLVSWAPQTAVLSHPSVGTFLTHCDWNSTIESIASGVPMLGWPRYADHTTDCHYITQVWRIGLALESRESPVDRSMVVPREEVDRKVRKMMANEDETDAEVADIQTNSRKYELASRKAVVQGGSSHSALTKLVKLVESWRTKQEHPFPPSRIECGA